MFTPFQLRLPPGNNKHRPPWLLRYRSSKSFIIATVTAAVFTVRYPYYSSNKLLDKLFSSNGQDIFLYAVIVPVIPFALQHRVNIAPSQGEKVTLFDIIFRTVLSSSII